jgi:hypothetical protein
VQYLEIKIKAVHRETKDVGLLFLDGQVQGGLEEVILSVAGKSVVSVSLDSLHTAVETFLAARRSLSCSREDR